MKNWVEFTAKTVSDAITEASVTLKVQSSMIEYEVIEEEKNGLLGLFSRPARIRACLKEDLKTETPEMEKKTEIRKETKKEINREINKDYKKEFNREINKDYKKEFNREISKDYKKEFNRDNKNEFNKELIKDIKKETVVPVKRAEPFNEDVDVEGISKKFLKDVFNAMDIEAVIEVSFNREEGIVNINVVGDDMGILIGKRGQTLDSLQYLTSLVINKETNSYLKVKLDTENYRERRRETLENLAKNIAFKVKRTKRPVSLEPMNPYERRIIHSALQGDKFVETHSEGEEPYRKVVITLKKGYRDYGNRNNQGGGHRYNNRKDYPRRNFSERETAEIKTED